MKKSLTSLLLMFFLGFMTFNIQGCLFTNVRVPLDEDVWQTKLGDKEGISSSHILFWLIAWGDGGTKKAAENGNIKIVHHMDRGIKSFLFGVYSRIDTVVYGE